MSRTAEFVEKVRAFVDPKYEWYKRKSAGFLLLVSGISALFGLLLLGAGIFLTQTFETSSGQLVSIVVCVFGVIVVLVALLGCAVIRLDHLKVVIAYMTVNTLLMLSEIVMAFTVITYLNSLGYVYEVNNSLALTNELDHLVSDFVNGLYADCCVGVNTNCRQNVFPKDCVEVAACPATLPNGVTQCFIVGKPTVDPGLCGTLQNAGWGKFGKPVVGPASKVIAEGTSCGAGDPHLFMLSIIDWTGQNYAWISAVLFFVIVVQIMATFTSFAAYNHMRAQVANVYDPKRPFEGEKVKVYGGAKVPSKNKVRRLNER